MGGRHRPANGCGLGVGSILTICCQLASLGFMASPSALSELLDKIRTTQGNAWAATDLIVSGSTLSPARFTLLRAIASIAAATTVPSLARHLAVSRQAVQRLVDGLAKDGILALRPNPHHLKAPLVVITADGSRILHQYEARYQEWLASVAANFSAEEVGTTFRLLDRLQTIISKSDPEQVGL